MHQQENGGAVQAQVATDKYERQELHDMDYI